MRIEINAIDLLGFTIGFMLGTLLGIGCYFLIGHLIEKRKFSKRIKKDV